MDQTVSQRQLTRASQGLLDYWLKIRDGEIIPSRSSLRPGDIPSLLPSIMLFEYREPDVLIFRLAGTELSERMGVEFAGMNLFDLVLPEQRADAHHWYNAVRNQPCGVVIYKQLRSKYGTGFFCEQIYLPLRDREGNVSQLVGMCNVVERHKAGHVPDDLQSLAVIGVNFLDIGAGAPAEWKNLSKATG